MQSLKYSHPRGVSRRADLDTQSEVPPISGIDINWKLSRNAASKTPPQTEGIRMFPRSRAIPAHVKSGDILWSDIHTLS